MKYVLKIKIGQLTYIFSCECDTVQFQRANVRLSDIMSKKQVLTNENLWDV